MANIGLVGSFQASTVITTVVAAQILYFVGLAVYRLFFHPLAKIPGPKLAALTGWYESYYELAPPGGQFMWEIRRLHDVYGPIVRINPNEVHIQDSQYYEDLYNQSLPLNKLDKLQYRFNNHTALFPTPDHHVHRQRRAALNPFFSKRKMSSRQASVQETVNRLCDRLDREYKGTGKVLPVKNMWGALTCDLIVAYCFDQAYDSIELPEFNSPLPQAIADLVGGVHIVGQFTWLPTVTKLFPESMIAALNPAMKTVFYFNGEMRKQIAAVLQRKDSKQKVQTQTIFDAILESNLPPSELSPMRLEHEAIGIVGAGMETTLWALTVGLFHIFNNPTIQTHLREELEKAIPDFTQMPTLETLEQLPYLSACIEESIRLIYGTTQRSPRTHPEISIRYKDWVIPPACVVSMDNYSVSHDESIFPDSHSFKPERWLGSPRAPDGRQLSRYMINFGRGPRTCVGQNMAYAELYIAMATVYRRFTFELYETGRDAVDCYSDFFTSYPKHGTQVRALVK